MSKFDENIAKLRASLKDMVNADNATQLASLDKIIDDAVEAHNATKEALDEAKGTIVDLVKNTSFKTPSGDSTPDLEVKSLDEIMEEELNKIK